MIDIDSISVSFDDHTVLEDVSLSVDEGTFIGLIGPNGAGKTTMLRTISGVIDPESGTVTINGTEVHSLSSKATSRLVSVVPQNTSLSFAFDVRHIVEMGRTPHRSRFGSPTKSDERVVDRALERTRTERFEDRTIDEVSGGERQRVLLARALAQDTPVMLLDEPTASLDINHQLDTLEIVSELVEDGKTVIAAIHDLDLAARFCDQLALLKGGSIIESGDPTTVLTTENIKRVFDTDAAVTTNPVTGAKTITAVKPGHSRDY